MSVLAFDTCFAAVSVAVRWQMRSGQWLLREAGAEREAGPAEALVPMIRDVMAAAGLGFKDLDRLAVTLGPGTFTGVRVGIATARALKLATGLAVVGLPSLAVMAHGAMLEIGAARQQRLLAVAVDARGGHIYFQLFRHDVDDPLTEPTLATPEAAAREIGGRPAIIVGSGARRIAQCTERSGSRPEIALEGLKPQARDLALLAAGLPTLDIVRPLYLRAPDAKAPTDATVPRAP